MNKKRLTLMIVVLFLFMCTGVGDAMSKSKAAHPTKVERTEAGVRVKLPTVDDEWIVGNYYTAGHKQIIIVLNDISENINLTGKKDLCTYLLQYFDVLNIDFRGQGTSSGDFTGGNTEVLDIQAALHFLESKEYDKIGILGYGFGGYLAIQGSAFLKSVDSIVTVNAPYYLYRKEAKNYEQGALHLVVQFGQDFVERIIGIRLSDQLPDQSRPLKPYLESMQQALLVIYVRGDHQLTEEESRLIYQHAKSPRGFYAVSDDQVRISDRKIIYTRTVDWFKHTFITK